MAIVIIAIMVVLGLYMAWSIGANDVANSMADAVGSGALTVKRAVIAAGLCEFAGAVLVGSHVTDTVRKGIVDPQALAACPEAMVLGMGCALAVAALWLHGASWFGMPVSTTHSIVGGVAGFGIVATGWGGVHWGTMGKIVASWFISPLAGGFVAFVGFRLISRFILGRKKPTVAASRYAPIIVFVTAFIVVLATVYKGLKHIVAEKAPWLTGNMGLAISAGAGLVAALVALVLVRRYLRGRADAPLAEQMELVERVFVPLVIATSCCVAFAHGANDVANSVGPLAAIVDILATGSVKMKVGVPVWILALGGGGIVLGLAMYGYRVMRTVGTKITPLTPTRGVAADIAAMGTVLACTRLKLPVSTTHTLVGAIFGIGLARGLGALNMRVTRNILASWLITVPITAGLTALLFVLLRPLLLGPIAGTIRSAAGG